MEAPAGELTCPRHNTPTRLTCVECSTPICPKCAIRTPVGFKCPDHATAGRTRRRAPNNVIAPLVVIALIGGFFAVRHFSVAKPAKQACPTRSGPDVGIGPNGGGQNWTEMAKSPICGRFAAATAWTGKDLLVWGGQSCAGSECPSDRAIRLGDGAAYDPAKDRWTKLAGPAPIEARDWTANAWTGKQLVIWGGTSRTGPLADGAAYDPAAKKWHKVAASPLAPRAHTAFVWTGKELLVWGGSGQADGAAYDPAANTWRSMAAAPLAGRDDAVAVWTGKEMIVWGGSTADGQTLTDGAAYDPAASSWRRIAPAPLSPRDGPAAVWTGNELLLWGGDQRSIEFSSDGAAYKPSTDTWRPLPASPVAGRANPLTVWSGTEMVFWGGLGLNSDTAPPAVGRAPGQQRLPFFDVGPVVPLDDGAAYNPATDKWRRLQSVTLVGRGYGMGAWDGKGMIVWGGLVLVDSPASAADGARYSP